MSVFLLTGKPTSPDKVIYATAAFAIGANSTLSLAKLSFAFMVFERIAASSSAVSQPDKSRSFLMHVEANHPQKKHL